MRSMVLAKPKNPRNSERRILQIGINFMVNNVERGVSKGGGQILQMPWLNFAKGVVKFPANEQIGMMYLSMQRQHQQNGAL